MSHDNERLRVTWVWRSRNPARHPANPSYPRGVDLDVSLGATSCHTALPYPAPGLGLWQVECQACGFRLACTAAGRRDDPRSLRIPCRSVVTARLRA